MFCSRERIAHQADEFEEGELAKRISGVGKVLETVVGQNKRPQVRKRVGNSRIDARDEVVREVERREAL